MGGSVEHESQNKWAKLSWLKGDGASPPPPSTDRAQPERPKSITLDYRPPPGKLGVVIVACAAAALFMQHVAATNDRGLIINGLIHLGPEGATIFYWCAAIVSAACAAWCLLVFVPQVFIRRQIVLEEDAITLPGTGFSTKGYRIPWDEIEGATRRTYQKVTYLKVRHRGRRFAVNSAWLPSNLDVETIETYLTRKCGPFR